MELALRNSSYEVLPLRSAEESIVSAVPLTVPLSITMTAGKGVQPTVELAERLAAHGYTVTPHLAARMFRDREHLADTVDRLRGAGVCSAFVVAGDGDAPHGPFADALALLEELQTTGHPFGQLGIGGYPEGHGHLADDLISHSLQRKSAYATHITTQMCFNPAATLAWAREVRSGGVCLPIRIGLPGAVTRQKLVRISAGLGLGPSARFLLGQRNMFWRFFLPGGYRPDRHVQALAPRFGEPGHPSPASISSRSTKWPARRLGVRRGSSVWRTMPSTIASVHLLDDRAGGPSVTALTLSVSRLHTKRPVHHSPQRASHTAK